MIAAVHPPWRSAIAMYDGRADARYLRQDRAGAADGGAAVRPPADHLRALRPDADRHSRTRKKQRVRQLYAEGKATRAELLESEMKSYHSPGTCTFFGTANSNQMMMEMMGLHIPGSAFVQPGTQLRQALDREGGDTA